MNRGRDYEEYRRLLRERDVFGQWDRWRDHLAELRAGTLPRAPRRRRRPQPPLPTLTMAQLRRWWQDRFTPTEIYEMASAIDYLLQEEEAA